MTPPCRFLECSDRSSVFLFTVQSNQILAFWFVVWVTQCSASLAADAATAQEAPPEIVTVSPVVSREVAAEASFVATVRPLRRSVVGSAVDGRVVEFLGPGERSETKLTRVPKGQALAKLRTGTIEIELAAARAELELRIHAHAELENGSRPEEKAQALARKLAAEARMIYARSKYERRKLRENEQRSIVSGEEIDLALADANEAEQLFQEASAHYDLVLAGPRPEKIAQAKAQVDAQGEEIRRLEDRLLKYSILAPFDGYVVAEHTEVGAWLSQGDPVAEVVQLATVELETFVPERLIVAVRVGMETRVTLEAIPGDEFTGCVDRIISEADTRSRSFPVKIRLTNPETDDGHLLRSGMLARVIMAVGARKKVLLVPKDSLVLGGPSPRIFVVREGGHNQDGQCVVDPVDVQLGVASGDLIQVMGQVHEGQQVIDRGNERLRPGQIVRIVATETVGG